MSTDIAEVKENSQNTTTELKINDFITDLNTLWEYEHTKGKWVRYSDELADKLNQTTEEFFETEMEEARLRLDLSSMKQLNLETGFKRNLRCVVQLDDNSPFVCWEIKKGRLYEPLTRCYQINFENALAKNSVEIEFHGAKCKVDFDAMKIDAPDPLNIRRTISMAESSFSAAPVLPARRTRALTKRSLNVDAMGSTQLNEEDEKLEEKKEKRSRNTKSTANTTKSGKSKPREYETKKTMILKGRAPVDPECREKVNSAHVLEEGDLIWDAMLNQTNVGNNNNKYYLMQLLQDDNSNNYSVWFRWGRVGYPGQNALNTFGGNIEGAKACFSKKFYDKTHNEWQDKSQFQSVPGKYKLIHQLLQLICNIQAMNEAVMELEFDTTRSPLGKLTAHQIAEGYRLLGELEELIKNKKFGAEFVQVVNDYYTNIPHNFGYQQPPLIKTMEMIKKETDLLEILEEIEIAVKSFGEAKKSTEKLAVIDKYYNNMRCDVIPVEKNSADHMMIEKYMKLTHGDTHMYSMKITGCYQVGRHTEKERFRKDIGNRMLLWHGSRVTNFYGILSLGLRIAPPEAPACGYMFGKGIYFADMASKSGNYCFPAPGKPGLLLLCEVALGECNELYQADYDAEKKLKGKNSTKGVGRTYPNEKEYFTLADGTIVPCGKPTNYKNQSACTLLYNEYIVYDVAQVRIRYLVEVEFDM